MNKSEDKPHIAFGDVQYRSVKEDVRKHKTYYREVSVYISLYMSGEKHRDIDNFSFEREGRHSYGWAFVKEELLRQLEAEGYTKQEGFSLRLSGNWISSISVKDESHPGFGYDKELTVQVARRFTADKPSQIISEEEGFEKVPVTQLAEDLPHYVENALGVLGEKMAIAERARVGNLICNHYADMISERARKAVRWSQRLAALEAEFQAEVAAQVDDLLTELDGDQLGFDFEDGFQPDPRSVAAAKKRLPEVASEIQPPTKRNIFRHAEEKRPVTADDVQ